MLSISEIKTFIENDINSTKKKLARLGQRYYEAEHDIMSCRFFYYNADGKLVEDTARSNIKISHPFFTELSDQLTAYMLSFKENPIKAKKTADGLQEKLDIYFDDDFWAEISELISGTYNKGFEYLYAYKNTENRLAFECADSMGIVEVRAKDTDDNCEYIIYWYIDRVEKGKQAVRKIQVWDDKQTHYYKQLLSGGTGGEIELDKGEDLNPRPHVVFKDLDGNRYGYSLGYIPFWRLDYNRKQTSGLKPIKGLIDDYDLMCCGLSNNLADFDTPLHVVKGFSGDNLDELQQNLKTKKIIGTDEGGDVELRTIDIPYQARKAKADEDEKNIYRFGMGFNSSQVGDGNVTNIVIRSRYTLLELKAGKLERRLKQLLKSILKVVIDEINATNDTAYKVQDVYFNFEKNVMTNESENVANEKVKSETQQIKINTLLNLAATLDNETVLRGICEVLDVDYEEIKDKVPSAQGDELDGLQKLLFEKPTNEPQQTQNGAEQAQNTQGEQIQTEQDTGAAANV